MKVICDSNIPYIRQGLEALADEVAYMPGADITADAVRDADALVVRTRTRVDSQLLQGSSVQMVVTATIGYDHIDTQFLDSQGIAWTNCPGCNATSVAQYVHSTVLVLIQRGLLPEHPVVGIVGRGHVGTAVEKALRPMAADILVSDPPLGLHADLTQADIISFHTPLTRDGQHATWHLADESLFARLTHPTVIVNAARGGVVDEKALLRAMDSGRVSAAVIDTWEGEPQIDRRLLERAVIATPHIAGYSADGKANASRMSLEALARHFGRTLTIDVAPPDLPNRQLLPTDPIARALALYNPLDDCLNRASNDIAATFEHSRHNYPLRKEQ